MPQEDKEKGPTKEGLELFRVVFVVKRKSPEIEQPGEGPSYHPTVDLEAQETCTLGQPVFPS